MGKEVEAGDGKADGKRPEDHKKFGRAAVRLPLADLKVGDFLSQTQFMQILDIAPDRSSFQARILRSAKPEDQGLDDWKISTSFPYQACSAAHFVATEKLTKTQMARRFMDVGSANRPPALAPPPRGPHLLKLFLGF